MSVHKATPSIETQVTPQRFESLILHAKSLFNKLKWLSPTQSLITAPSSKFGRNIEKELNNLRQQEGTMMLKLRQQDSAVVMSVEHYEQMLEMKETLAQLLAAEASSVINTATDDYDTLYSRITAPQSKQAADALFSASPEKLSESFSADQKESK